MRSWRTRFGAVLLVVIVVLGANAGKFLIVDEPQRSDVIVVLAGETDRRPAYAVHLLDQGYAPRVLIDVPAREVIFGTNETELAEKYIHSLPEAASIGICPTVGLSTRDESHDVKQCLEKEQAATRVLVVTSDFHTRRALSIFRRELPGKNFSVAAARDETQFGAHWWMHRQWAKTCVDEWLRVIWWNAVERWR